MGVRTVRITTARSSVWAGVALSASLLASVGSAGAASSPAQLTDEQRILAAASPEAAALVAKGEGLVAQASKEAGATAIEQLKQAWIAYAQAWTLVPRSAMPPRGICRLALLIGERGGRSAQQQSAAGAACQNALVLGGTAEDMRNRVAAWVMGPAAPTLDNLVAAFAMADGAVRRAPGEPWGYLARADLAQRLGDRALFDAALADLRRVAPQHQATRRLAGGPLATSWGRIIARSLFFVLLLATAVHAGRRRLRARRRLIAVSALAVASVIFAPPSVAAPAPLARALIAPTPEQQLDNPLAFAETLMDMSARAEAATARGDHATAAALYGEVAKAVPGASYPLARMCDALEAAGNLDAAIDACRAALTRTGIKEGDFTDFVRLVLSKPAGLTDTDRRQLDLVIAQLARDPRAALTATRLRCNVAVHERDLAALSACTAELAQAAPEDPRTVSFHWALAYERRQALASEWWLRRARTVGVEADSLERMTGATRELTRQRAVRVVAWAAAGIGLFVALIVGRRLLLGLARRRRSPRGDDTSVQRKPART